MKTSTGESLTPEGRELVKEQEKVTKLAILLKAAIRELDGMPGEEEFVKFAKAEMRKQGVPYEDM